MSISVAYASLHTTQGAHGPQILHRVGAPAPGQGDEISKKQVCQILLVQVPKWQLLVLVHIEGRADSRIVDDTMWQIFLKPVWQLGYGLRQFRALCSKMWTLCTKPHFTLIEYTDMRILHCELEGNES
jgi:hypothetical protein